LGRPGFFLAQLVEPLDPVDPLEGVPELPMLGQGWPAEGAGRVAPLDAPDAGAELELGVLELVAALANAMPPRPTPNELATMAAAIIGFLKIISGSPWVSAAAPARGSCCLELRSTSNHWITRGFVLTGRLMRAG
jgi:hypothetical protein